MKEGPGQAAYRSRLLQRRMSGQKLTVPLTRCPRLAVSRIHRSQSAARLACRLELFILRAAKSSNHPAFVRIKEVSISRADMRARGGERSTAPNFLTNVHVG